MYQSLHFRSAARGRMWAAPLVLSFAGLLLVSACGETGAGVQSPSVAAIAKNNPFPADFRKEVVDFEFAGLIAFRCGFGVRINEEARTALMQRTKIEAQKRGIWPPSNIKASLIASEREVQDRFIAYVQMRNILVSQPGSWCAAAEKEIKEKTAIGKYLKSVG